MKAGDKALYGVAEHEVTIISVTDTDAVISIDEFDIEKTVPLGDLESAGAPGEPNRDDFPAPNHTKSGYYDDLDFTDASDPYHYYN